MNKAGGGHGCGKTFEARVSKDFLFRKREGFVATAVLVEAPIHLSPHAEGCWKNYFCVAEKTWNGGGRNRPYNFDLPPPFLLGRYVPKRP
jgi:hypothetical protein